MSDAEAESGLLPSLSRMDSFGIVIEPQSSLADAYDDENVDYTAHGTAAYVGVGEDDEDVEYREPIMQGPPPDPKREIDRFRTDLIDKISENEEQVPWKSAEWQKEQCKRGSKAFGAYQQATADLLEIERKFFFDSKARGLDRSDRSMNFFQHVLHRSSHFSPLNVRLRKVKFVLWLIAELDKSQLDPKYGPKQLLHAAVDGDLEMRKTEVKDDGGSSLTAYVCNLVPEQLAAGRIAECNEDNENILHLAIRHDLAGVEDLIRRANKRALGQQRKSRTHAGGGPSMDDGNTPLHDALNFQKLFLLPGHLCQVIVPSPPTGSRLDGPPADKEKRAAAPNSTPARQPGAMPVSSNTTSTPPIMNQRRVRERPVPFMSSELLSTSPGPTAVQRGRVLTPTACRTCLSAAQKRETTLEKRRRVIKLLIDGDKSVLSKHNTSGLSPYMSLFAEWKRFNDGKLQKAKAEPERQGDDAGDPSPTLNIPDIGQLDQPPRLVVALPTPVEAPKTPLPDVLGIITKGRDAKRVPTLIQREDDLSSELARKQQEEEAQEKKQKLAPQRAEPAPAARKDGISQPTVASRAGKHTNVASVPIKNAKIRAHLENDLEPSDIGAHKILSSLKELSFTLGDQQRALDCLFRNQKAKGPSPFPGEQDRRRKLTLEETQRVTYTTTENFDFLLFEPMMAAVVLSLDYTADQIKALPTDEEKRHAIWGDDEKGLKKVFSWLKRKEVKCIVSLTVKENPRHYCSDHTVKECLEGLEVRYLDWNRPDLCANSGYLPHDLIEVSLRWSGLDSVLWGWSDTKGLVTLKKLRKLQLYIQDVGEACFCSMANACLTTNELQGGELADQLNEKVQAFKERLLKVQRIEVVEKTEDRRMRGHQKGGGAATKESQLNPWLQITERFSDKFYTQFGKVLPRVVVRVALLDDGVDPTYDKGTSLGLNLHHTGWPTEDSADPDHRHENFYSSTNQHGSKMASLIRKVCPFVVIHIAKLDVQTSEGKVRHRTFNLEEAIKAIDWARSQNVDIISMSWNIREFSGESNNLQGIRDLETAITAAANSNILMFGAACDEKRSASSDRWFPCDHPSVFSIGATDRDFDPKKYVDMSKKVDFLFPGEDVLEGEDSDVGNSGATALASGLAALALACVSTGCPGRQVPRENRSRWIANTMKKTFQSESNGKKVRVEDVLKFEENDSAYLTTLREKIVSDNRGLLNLAASVVTQEQV